MHFALVFEKYRRLPDDVTIGLALVDICLPQRRHPIGQHSARVRKDDPGFEPVAVIGSRRDFVNAGPVKVVGPLFKPIRQGLSV